MMLPRTLVELALDEEDVLLEVPPRSPIELSTNEEIIDCALVEVVLVVLDVPLAVELLVAPDS